MRNTILAVAVVIFGCSLALGQAQEKILYRFNGSPDGSRPVADLVFDSAGNLYGTTEYGGAFNWGTVFKLSHSPDGTWTEEVIYDFCTNNVGGLCLDGVFPVAGLIFDSVGNLYGTTSGGGPGCGKGYPGCGVVFELSPPTPPQSSWIETVLYSFCSDYDPCPDGFTPSSKLIFDGLGNLYGVTEGGGANGNGTVFELSPSPTGWTESVLYSFCSVGKFPACPDGWGPTAGLTFDDVGNLYGTTSAGGNSKFEGGGVVYKLSKSEAWKETVLYVGNRPKGGGFAGNVSFDTSGNLYSTATGWGTNNAGSVFRLSPKNGGTVAALSFDWTNGGSPFAGVLIDPRNGDLYGTTSGDYGDYLGTVFRVSGKTIDVLYHFSGGEDGQFPVAALIADKKGHLYGTTEYGGNSNQGVVFEIIP